MRQNSKRFVAVALCSSLIGSCSIPISGPRMSSSSIVPPSTRAERPANEILLTRRGSAPVLGKLVGIEAQDVTFLPAPYWNVPTEVVPLDDIVAIQVTEVGSSKGRAAGLSFATGFVVTGALCGADSEYKEDYEACVLGAAAIGAIAGLIGLGVGAIKDRGRPKTHYRFDQMTPAEKREAVQRLVAR